MTFKISNKNFLITGGTGQIGSFLTEKLLENNANVTVLGHNIENLKEIKNLVDTKKIKYDEILTNNNDVADGHVGGDENLFLFGSISR